VEVNLPAKIISIDVYLNFKQNDLTTSQFSKLKQLAIDRINHYWSQSIKVDGVFKVQIKAIHRINNSISVDLNIEHSGKYSRSSNPVILGIDATFTYNKDFFSHAPTFADQNFKLVSAHEFGHSVLTYADGLSLSWGHKGSTNSVL
jgi:hypothetical protein